MQKKNKKKRQDTKEQRLNYRKKREVWQFTIKMRKRERCNRDETMEEENNIHRKINCKGDAES